MALHIQMSEEAEKELKRNALRNQLSSILVSLAVMILGGGSLFFAVILIVQEAPAVFVSYVPPTENLPPSASPTTAELSSKAATPSNTVSPTVIVSTGAAPVQMAAVDIEAADIDMDAGIDISMGLGTDLGDGLGDGGSGLGEGSPGGSALEGVFYDLKQTRSGGRSSVVNKDGGVIAEEVCEVYHNFTKSFNRSVLSKFYQSPTKLYASNFFLPQCSANYGPIAFQCQDKVKPSGWIAVYKGRVKAPKSGKFRFVGVGDEFIVVRFNRKTVLEAGWCIPSLYSKDMRNVFSMGEHTEKGRAYLKGIKEGKDKDHKDYELVRMKEGWNLNQVGGLMAGTPFSVKAGQVYEIEIAVSEGPGGAFGFMLFIEDIDGNPQGKKKSTQRVYDIFRTNFSLPNQTEIKELLQKARCLRPGEMEAPPYNEDSPIWVAVP